MFKIFSIKRLVLIPCLILTGFLLFLPGFVSAAYVGEANLENKPGFDWKAGVYDTPDSVADAAKITEDPNKLALDFVPGGRYFSATGPNLVVAKAKAPNGEEIHVVKVISGSMRGYVVDYQAFKAGKGRLLAVGKTVDDSHLVTAAGNGAPLTMDARGTTGEFEQTLGDRIIGGDPYDGAISSELIFAQMVSIFFVSIATIVYLIIDIVLLGRWVMLIILAVISPLPFILMILPATQKYARMWWQKFMKWAFVGVLITFFLWLVPQVLATKEGGYWEARDIETFMPPGAAAANWMVTGETGGDTTDVKVIYPKFLGGDNSGADFVEGFIMFSVAVGFMIAAAWVSITLGETAGKVALGIPRAVGKAARAAGKGVKWGAKKGIEATGVPGGVKARARDIMGDFARGKQRREAAVRELLGEPGARTAEVLRQATGMKKDMDEKGLLTTPGQREDFFGGQKAGSVGYLAGALAMAENGELGEDRINEVAGHFGDRKEYVESLLRDKNKKKRPSTRFPKYIRDEAGNLVIDKERGGKIRSMYGNMTSAQLAEVKPDEFKDENAQLGVSLDEVIKLSPGTRNLIARQIEAKIGELNFDLGKAQPGSAAFNVLKNTVGELRKRHAVVSGNPEASYTKISPSSKAEADKELTTFVQTVEPKFLADMSSKVLSSLAPRMNVGALNMIGQQKGISPDKLKSVVKSINEKGKNEIINYLRMNEFWSPYQKEHTGEGSKARPPQQFE